MKAFFVLFLIAVVLFALIVSVVEYFIKVREDEGEPKYNVRLL